MRRRAFLTALGAATVAGCQSTGTSAEIVASRRTLVDEELDLAVRGLPGGGTLQLTAEAGIDPDRGTSSRWSASATFRIPDDGTVRPGEQAPLSGSYDGVQPMGLVWSMTTDTAPRDTFFPLVDHDLHLEAAVDGSTVATATVERRVAVEGITTEAPGGDLVGTIHLPPGDAVVPGLVLLHGSTPRERSQTAKLLASHGFAALSLKYFGDEQSLPPSLSEIPVEYVQRAIDSLLGHERVGGSQVAVWGVSKGAELALLVGSADDRVGAVVGTAPSSVVWEGFDKDGYPTGTSSWTVDGDPVPYLPYADYDAVGDRSDPFDRPRGFYEYSHLQADPEDVAAATIPVERIDGPVLLVSGRDDRLWHSTPMGNRLRDRLASRNHPYDDTHLAYDDTGHVVPIPYVPTYGTSASPTYPLGGSPAATARASRDHWPKVLSTFTHLDEDALDPTVGTVTPRAVAGSESTPQWQGPALVALLSAVVAFAVAARRAGPASNTGILNRETHDAIVDGLDSPKVHYLLTVVLALGGLLAVLAGLTGAAFFSVLFAFIIGTNYASEQLWSRSLSYFKARDAEPVERTLAPSGISAKSKTTIVTGTALFVTYLLFAALLVIVASV